MSVSGMPQTFISYSRGDSEFALKLARDLRKAGASIWVDQLDIAAGEHWPTEVEKALEACAQLLVILSPDSVDSRNVMDEVNFALDESRKVVPVLFRECRIPYRLRGLQHSNFTGDYRSGFAKLQESLGGEQEPESGANSLESKDGLEYVWIPPGEFLMGATPGDEEAAEDEKPQHPVSIS